MEVSGQLHAPDALTPGKELSVPIGQEAGWTPEAVWTTWRRAKAFVAVGNVTPAIQLVGHRYTYLQEWELKIRAISTVLNQLAGRRYK
jgi:hypothetical protein